MGKNETKFVRFPFFSFFFLLKNFKFSLFSKAIKIRTSSKGKRVPTNNRQRLLNTDLRGDYWLTPLMSHENAFVARKAYYLAIEIKERYALDELPRIRWLASYKIWGLGLLCLLVLYILWKFAVFLASNTTG